jgi:hypothetical protein
MPITFGMKRSSYLCSYLCSQITGSVENAVPLHVDIPRTGGRGFDLHSEGALQEYLKFTYECFLSVRLPFEGYCYKLCPSNNPRRKKKQHGLRSGEHAGQISLLIILSPEHIGQSLHRHTCNVGSSCVLLKPARVFCLLLTLKRTARE